MHGEAVMPVVHLQEQRAVGTTAGEFDAQDAGRESGPSLEVGRLDAHVTQSAHAYHTNSITTCA
jgi:hypothetical protein